MDEESKELIEKALSKEKDSEVKEVLLEAKTIILAKYSSGEEQIKAVKDLSDFISSDTLATLKTIANKEGISKELQKAANSSISSVETIRSYYGVLEKAFFGLSMGSVLLLAAIGLAITFGVMKVINMAHGEMMMIGAYTTYTLQQIMPNLIEYSIIVAIPAAFIVSGIVGIIIERLVIKHLYGRPLETLLATFDKIFFADLSLISFFFEKRFISARFDLIILLNLLFVFTFLNSLLFCGLSVLPSKKVFV